MGNSPEVLNFNRLFLKLNRTGSSATNCWSSPIIEANRFVGGDGGVKLLMPFLLAVLISQDTKNSATCFDSSPEKSCVSWLAL